jgi:hypothetical protein
MRRPGGAVCETEVFVVGGGQARLAAANAAPQQRISLVLAHAP